MPQWLVIIRNSSDPSMLERRVAVRPAHLANVKDLAARGTIVAGGALLDEANSPAGTVAMVDFTDRAALDDWLQTDPYATGRVWESFEVMPIAITVRAP